MVPRGQIARGVPGDPAEALVPDEEQRLGIVRAERARIRESLGRRDGIVESIALGQTRAGEHEEVALHGEHLARVGLDDGRVLVIGGDAEESLRLGDRDLGAAAGDQHRGGGRGGREQREEPAIGGEAAHQRTLP